MHRYRQLFRYAWRRWPGLVVIVALTVVSSAATALQPWPLKLLVDYALGDAATPGWLADPLMGLGIDPTPLVLVMVAAAAGLGLFFLRSAVSNGLTWFWSAVGERMVYDLSADLYRRLLHLSLTYHKRSFVGDLLSRLTSDSYCVYKVVSNLLVSPLQQVFTLVSIGVLAWRLNPHLTMLSFVVAPVLGGLALYFGGRLKRQSLRYRQGEARLVSFVHQTLTAIPVVQAFGTEGRNRRRFDELARQFVGYAQEGNVLKEANQLANGLVTTLGRVVILYVGSLQVLSGALTIGSLLVFLAYVDSIQSAFRSLFGLYGELKYAEAKIDRVFEVIEAEDEVPVAPSAYALPAPARGDIRLESLTFGYRLGEPVLWDVSLQIEPEETVALVGPTGAGKSTLISLLFRFFDPWQGSVYIDGHDVRGLQLESLRSQIALVLQEPFLLPLSVAENIAYGRPGATRAEIEAAAEAANAAEFIAGMPEGYETVLGERGATLSGGQRQRLAIARALLKDAPIVVLDEPTSALDATTEAGLMEALDRLMERRTVVVIAHRFTTVQRADRILFLKSGRIAETGSHADLLCAGGSYYKFYAHHFGAVDMEEVMS